MVSSIKVLQRYILHRYIFQEVESGFTSSECYMKQKCWHDLTVGAVFYILLWQQVNGFNKHASSLWRVLSSPVHKKCKVIQEEA